MDGEIKVLFYLKWGGREIIDRKVARRLEMRGQGEPMVGDLALFDE